MQSKQQRSPHFITLCLLENRVKSKGLDKESLAFMQAYCVLAIVVVCGGLAMIFVAVLANLVFWGTAMPLWVPCLLSMILTLALVVRHYRR